MATGSRLNRGLHFLVAGALVGLLSVEPVRAGEPSWVEAWTAQSGATGSWFGVRDTMSQFGITPTITYVADLLGNPVGGRRRGARTRAS